jgi:histidine triad (HIT) family protein
MSNCIFCKIISGDIPSTKVYEDESSLVFKDINPVAPVHLVAIPKAHCEAVHCVPSNSPDAIAKLFATVATVVKQLNLDKLGYRLVVNSGESAGQTVPHVHVHILSGRDLTWPPG